MSDEEMRELFIELVEALRSIAYDINIIKQQLDKTN